MLWLVGANLVFLPWAVGGMRLWTHFIGLGLAVAGMVLALWPRNASTKYRDENDTRIVLWPKLIRFPIFWLGLGLLGLVIIQALNPSWVFITDGKRMWIWRIPYIQWLPTSVQVPFSRWGAWSMLMIYATAWLTVCTVWIACTHRKTVRRIFLIIAGNGLALTVFGLIHHFSGAKKMFWFWTQPKLSYPFASFIYKNHAGAYLFLGIVVICALGVWYHARGLRRLQKSTPVGPIVFLAILMAIAIFSSSARGATIITLVFFLYMIAYVGIRQFLLPRDQRNTAVAVVLLAMIALFVSLGLAVLRSDAAWRRFARGVSGDDGAFQNRVLLSKVWSGMLAEVWPAGIGAGSFKERSFSYAAPYPTLKVNDRGRIINWVHAHNDFLEILIELGLAGSLLIAGAVACLVLALIRARVWRHPFSLTLIPGLLLLLFYAWWDFPFQSIAILNTWCVCWAGLVLWARIEGQGPKITTTVIASGQTNAHHSPEQPRPPATE